ncbi:MAG: MBOAT family protein [Lachnospiraceae bacterium]|nr:MBOAT family protein [Lachnospiraceae bacterium]
MGFLKVIFPMGISYYSFSAISYLVDIYREDVRYEKSFLKFLLYMLMFPKITAGPIVRYKDISGQLACGNVTLEKSAEGAKRFCIGLAKKVLIADQLGAVADQIFSLSSSEYLVSTAWLGAICYMLQIYHDFSGYSDMAIGIGKICGFDFLENFNYPYISKSMTEFWRRWHISLSSWFRDYLYIPLGGNRRGNQYLNLSIVFLATGLWHGGEWHFVLWGIWNGIFLLFEKLASKHCRITIPAALRHLYTLFVVMFGWILFRSDSISSGIHYILKLFGIGPTKAGFTLWWYLSPKLIGIIIVGILCCIPWKKREKLKNTALQYVLCICLLIVSIAAVMSSTYNSFIYFKF